MTLTRQQPNTPADTLLRTERDTTAALIEHHNLERLDRDFHPEASDLQALDNEAESNEEIEEQTEQTTVQQAAEANSD